MPDQGIFSISSATSLTMRLPRALHHVVSLSTRAIFPKIRVRSRFATPRVNASAFHSPMTHPRISLVLPYRIMLHRRFCRGLVCRS